MRILRSRGLFGAGALALVWLVLVITYVLVNRRMLPPQQLHAHGACAPILAFLTHLTSRDEAARVADLFAHFGSQFVLIFDGTRASAERGFPMIPTSRIVASGDIRSKLLSSMFRCSEQSSRCPRYNVGETGADPMTGEHPPVRTHELLYAWLLDDYELTNTSGSRSAPPFVTGGSVEKIFVIENDVYYESVSTLRYLVDRFAQSGVDFLSQNLNHATPRGGSLALWESMLMTPHVHPDAQVFEHHNRYWSILNAFGLSRRMLDQLRAWIDLNKGYLVYDEVLLGSLAFRHGLTTACFQHWLGENSFRNAQSMRWRPVWGVDELSDFIRHMRPQTPYGLLFHPVKPKPAMYVRTGVSKK